MARAAETAKAPKGVAGGRVRSASVLWKVDRQDAQPGPIFGDQGREQGVLRMPRVVNKKGNNVGNPVQRSGSPPRCGDRRIEDAHGSLTPRIWSQISAL